MNYAKAFDLLEAGQGRWDVQHHGTLLVGGAIRRTDAGVELLAWLRQRIGHFNSIENAQRFLLQFPRDTSLRVTSPGVV